MPSLEFLDLAEAEQEAEQEDRIVRRAICKLKGISRESLLAEANMIDVRKKQQVEDIATKAHLALWPQNDLEALDKILDQHQDLVLNSRFGKSKDPLIVRYVKQIMSERSERVMILFYE